MSKTLTVYLAADVSKLNSGLARGKRGLKDFEDGSSSLGSKLSGMVGPAMIGAAAAAGAFAVSLAVDGVKAAIEDEKAVAKLSTTLKNLGFERQTTNVLNFIDGLQRATGVSEDMLRPAFERLAISTNDVGAAQTSLQLAMDISAGTGKSLESVANALGKAYDGNTGALGKLGTGIDKAVLKSGDMQAITQELSKTFEGQAAAAADTFGGKLARLSVGFGELQESFGTGFLDGLSKSAGGIDGLMTQMQMLEPQMKALGVTTGQLASNVITLGGDAAALWNVFTNFSDNNAFVRTLMTIANHLTPLSWAFETVRFAAERLGIVTQTKLTGLDLLTNNGTFGAINRMNGLWETNTNVLTANTAATQKATAAQKLLDDRYQATLEIFNLAKTKLSDATRELEKWNSEIDTFISTTAGKITSGLNIGAAFEAATSEAGKAAGLTTAMAFQEQMAKALKFGNLLQKLKSSGAKDNLIQQVADVGPEAGVALAEDLIQSGLIPTLQSQLDQVQAEAATLAASMVPPFLLEGQSAARGAVSAALIEFQSAQTALEIAGKAAGHAFGAGLLDEIEAAIKAAQASLQNVKGGTGPAQMFQASPEVIANQALIDQELFNIATSNANYVASLLSAGSDLDRVIRQSNNRNGWYEMPTVTPVLQ
jgi:hypothetical protein